MDLFDAEQRLEQSGGLTPAADGGAAGQEPR
jgi:hypothetical protein